MIIFQLIYAYTAILVEVKVNIKFTLEQAMKAQRGSRGIALLFPNLSAGLDGCGKSRPYRDWIPGPYSPWLVAIPTELSRPIF
jgi:hypothetical protein